MNIKKRIVWLATAIFCVATTHAYEVWMGTHLSTSAQANDLPSWSMAAARLEGFNVNRAPHDTDPASNNDYRTIFAQFTNAQNTMTEFARSQATRNPANIDELAFPSIAERLEEIFSIENSFGYDLSILMFYDERGTYQGTEYLYEWTNTEIQYLRDWLDTNGHADVELMWNVRNNSVRNQQLAANPLVDSVEIEASTTALLANTNNQITFFNWFWTNTATANKRIALQIPRTLDSLNQFKGTRRVAQLIGGHIGYGDDGMRSDRLIFLPVTYNDNFPTIPETVNNGAAYTNSLASICLSLIEQRELFEGRLASLPTVADADSTVRTVPPTMSEIGNRVVAPNNGTGAIPFTVNDPDSALNSLTVTATSSDPMLVPMDGIAFGGSGANRTITLTPGIGRTGIAEITVKVSDGMWSAETRFRLAVGQALFSQPSDASVKDDQVVVDQNATTMLLGAGGSSPYVDRCAVYVFQLPDLGAVADPFTNAFFSFNFSASEGTLKDNDLYGLGRRGSAAVLGSDYYGQTATSDPSDATFLQANILTNGTPLGTLETSSDGSAALLAYLNTQYDSGAGIGEYVFLRLNTAAPKTGINRATLSMSEGPFDARPQIFFTGGSAPFELNAPVAHWPLDEGSGTVATDATGNGYTGELLNGASWGGDATRASYVTFDGTNDRISTLFNYALSSSDHFTWAWWANPAASTHSGSIMVGNRYPQGVPDETFEFIKFTPSGAQFSNTNDVPAIEKYNYAAPAPGSWHHYAMVKSGTSFQWYLDGVAQGSPVSISYNENAPIPFLVGGDEDSSARPNEHFEGFIDDVVLYNRALTPAEIAEVRNGLYSVEPTSGEMPGLQNDADVRDDLVIVNLGADNLVPGRSGGNGGFDRSSVFVFKLPDLGLTEDPFLTATLDFEVFDVSTTPPGVDLYGLGKRSSPNVLVGDYHGNTALADTSDATLIQSNILTEVSGIGAQSSNASAALSSYLNAQYDGGNGIGDYVFLRLSTNTPYAGTQRHFVTSADTAGSNGPLISFTAIATRDFDSWLAQFNFAPGADLSSGGDADLDGLSTRFEYLFGLDPSDATSNRAITGLLSKENNTFSYRRRNPSLTGVADYQIWVSENLTDWFLDPTAQQTTDGEGELQEVTVTLSGMPLPATKLFVQVRAAD